MGYKYKLADLNCDYCLDKGKRRCSSTLCPHIIDNLSELFADLKFRKAVTNAEKCRTLHKYTMIYLKKKAAEQEHNFLDDNMDTNTLFDSYFKPECRKCNYNSPGFICFNEKDGTCLVDWIKEIVYARS